MKTRVVPLPGSVSNAFLLLGKRPVLVDAGAPSEVPAILAMLASHGIAPSDVSLVVMTHGHADHAGVAATMAAAGVPVAVGADDARLLRTGRITTLPVTGPAGAALRPFIRRMAADRLIPDILIGRPLDLVDYGIAATVVPVGGHTPGSCVVLLDGGDAIVGDLVRAGFGLGRIRRRHPLRHYFAEDIDGVRRGLRLVLQHHPERLYVGHGGPDVSAADVQRRLDDVAPERKAFPP